MNLIGFTDVFLFYLSLITLLGFSAAAIEFVIGSRSVEFLSDILPADKLILPKVTVIIPARNEQRNIEEALNSILDQDYEHLEIIILDDRSTDQTGTILDRMAANNPRLKVLHINELPSGWLGKNHALYYGAQEASGELLLFADADIVLQASVISRAVNYLIEHRLDNLTIAPELRMPSIGLQMFAGTFAVFFSLFIKPWKAKDPDSKHYIGIGAFNMVRAEVYRSSGTHQAIAMRPDDDIMLGKLIKQHGYRQDILNGRKMICVEWYVSLTELIDGLMKNSFAGVNYSIAAVVAASAAMLLFNVWPFLGMFITDGATQAINIVIVFIVIVLCAFAARLSNIKPWISIGFPLASLLMIYILWRAMLITLINGGINWRGTHYPLAELKKNKV